MKQGIMAWAIGGSILALGIGFEGYEAYVYLTSGGNYELAGLTTIKIGVGFFIILVGLLVCWAARESRRSMN
ncbi:MAG: hypothetical protein KKB20_11950 [Proteobacteria bacterium]|nr:hypothetical protein [Pseudomonadota bacterium]